MAYTEIFTALADPTRRHIFEALRERPKSVTELAAGQPVSRPAVSQHLKVLAQAGLVDAVPEGTRRVYSVRREGLDALRTYLDSFWSDALNAYAREIEKQMNTH
jgi:DNA-binding transcriptional ArsR family regulator